LTTRADRQSAPDGSAALTLVEDDSTGYHRIYQYLTASSGQRRFCFSCCLNPHLGARDAALQWTTGSVDFLLVEFDLDQATVLSAGAAGAAELHSYGIRSVAPGWVRAWVGGVANFDVASNGALVYLRNADSLTYTGDGSMLAMWGAQVVRGPTPEPYRPVELDDTQVHVILEARIGNRELAFAGPDELVERMGPDWRTHKGDPLFILQEDEQHFRLAPYPEQDLAGLLDLHVALKPSSAAPGIDSLIHQEHKRRIAAGAKAMLMMTQGEPFFNPQLAASHEASFSLALGNVNWRVHKGRTRVRTRTKGHYF
jgi:hypothetical protein